ncbi:hypothetical protein KIPB_004886, partial [Kipferlia bialata]
FVSPPEALRAGRDAVSDYAVFTRLWGGEAPDTLKAARRQFIMEYFLHARTGALYHRSKGERTAYDVVTGVTGCRRSVVAQCVREAKAAVSTNLAWEGVDVGNTVDHWSSNTERPLIWPGGELPLDLGIVSYTEAGPDTCDSGIEAVDPIVSTDGDSCPDDTTGIDNGVGSGSDLHLVSVALGTTSAQIGDALILYADRGGWVLVYDTGCTSSRNSSPAENTRADDQLRFDTAFLPHLDAAVSAARVSSGYRVEVVLVVSHSDADHIGYLPHVLKWMADTREAQEGLVTLQGISGDSIHDNDSGTDTVPTLSVMGGSRVFLNLRDNCAPATDLLCNALRLITNNETFVKGHATTDSAPTLSPLDQIERAGQVHWLCDKQWRERERECVLLDWVCDRYRVVVHMHLPPLHDDPNMEAVSLLVDVQDRGVDDAESDYNATDATSASQAGTFNTGLRAAHLFLPSDAPHQAWRSFYDAKTSLWNSTRDTSHCALFKLPHHGSKKSWPQGVAGGMEGMFRGTLPNCLVTGTLGTSTPYETGSDTPTSGSMNVSMSRKQCMADAHSHLLTQIQGVQDGGLDSISCTRPWVVVQSCALPVLDTLPEHLTCVDSDKYSTHGCDVLCPCIDGEVAPFVPVCVDVALEPSIEGTHPTFHTSCRTLAPPPTEYRDSKRAIAGRRHCGGISTSGPTESMAERVSQFVHALAVPIPSVQDGGYFYEEQGTSIQREYQWGLSLSSANSQHSEHYSHASLSGHDSVQLEPTTFSVDEGRGCEAEVVQLHTPVRYAWDTDTETEGGKCSAYKDGTDMGQSAVEM